MTCITAPVGADLQVVLVRVQQVPACRQGLSTRVIRDLEIVLADPYGNRRNVLDEEPERCQSMARLMGQLRLNLPAGFVSAGVV